MSDLQDLPLPSKIKVPILGRCRNRFCRSRQPVVVGLISLPRRSKDASTISGQSRRSKIGKTRKNICWRGYLITVCTVQSG